VDDLLVRRAARGDGAAFEQLYREHVGRVYALCFRLTGDPREAEEFTQDAFIRAWQRLSSFRGDAAFSSWLHRLTVNVIGSAWRSRRRRGVWEVELNDATPAGAPPGDAERSLDLEAAIRTLPDGARAVFVLHDVEGYTHEEIGSMMGIATGTSKAQLHRARQILKGVVER
jgi:RNA polymerase sigma-70 factor (ECF subfamily)